MSEVKEMYNFLLIEDSVEDYLSFKDTIKRINLSTGIDMYQLTIAETYEEGLRRIEEKFDGIIVDIKLDDDHSGDDICRNIVDSFRVPVVVFTGTPGITQIDGLPIKVYKKGEASHEEILAELKGILSTGLFNVIGGKGEIDKLLTAVFWKNLYPQIELWRSKKDKGLDTEKILLRYAVAHIADSIDADVHDYVTEEMYISPPIGTEIRTGSILKLKDKEIYYVVLSPPCDLVMHNGKMKTDRVLVCEIESQDQVNSSVLDGVSKSKRSRVLQKALKNNCTDYYHWLPKNSLFVGGYVNFRKVETYSQEDINDLFITPCVKIQDSFVKSILGRFSSYYARQGQPDFQFSEEAINILGELDSANNDTESSDEVVDVAV